MSWTHGISGYVMDCRCEICKTAHRAYHTARNQARYDRGQCRHCGESRKPASVLCEDCLSDARNYQQARAARLRLAYVRGETLPVGRRRQTQEAA
jgi:hypothetical protein